jgi:hypothetical protein
MTPERLQSRRRFSGLQERRRQPARLRRHNVQAGPTESRKRTFLR